MQLLLRGVDVPKGELVLRDEQVGEAVGGFRVGFALGLFQLGDCGTAAAGDDEGGADALELEVFIWMSRALALITTATAIPVHARPDSAGERNRLASRFFVTSPPGGIA